MKGGVTYYNDTTATAPAATIAALESFSGKVVLIAGGTDKKLPMEDMARVIKQKTKAVIEYISPEAEYTPPIIYSQDTRYKLVYKVRATLPANIASSFHPGQPLDIYLNER